MDRVHGRGHGAIALGSLLVCMLAWSPLAFALDPSLDVSHYAHSAWNIREGFSKGIINAIAQTSDGYLWLGTEFGVLRFDGVRSVPWQPPKDQPLPSSQIWSLLTSRDGTLWIGTGKGLASWKDGKLTQYAELAGQNIYKLVEDREGTVWAGGLLIPAGKLCAIQKGSVLCRGEDGSLGPAVFSLYEDSKSNLWVGVMTGLWRWKPGPPKFYSFGETNGIRGLAEGDDGTLLVSTDSGIRQFVDGKTEAADPLLGAVPRFTVQLRDREGGLWIGTAGAGIVHVHQGRTDVFSQPDGLSGDTVEALFEDREGSVWVATVNGLDRFRDVAVATFSRNQGVSNAAVGWGAVVADRDGSVWLGTFDGLKKWNQGQITAYRNHIQARPGALPGVREIVGKDWPENVVSLFQDDRGRIWVATLGGLGYLENNRFVSLRGVPSGQVPSIAEDTHGNLWIANQENGLFDVHPGGAIQQIPWMRLGHKDNATALVSDRLRGGLWLGFLRGGIVDFSGDQVRASYTAANGLGDGRVNGLLLDRDNTLWAATEGGLSRVKNGRVATLTSKNGLPCDAVQWVIEDDAHSFWLCMACGLVRIARPELDAWAAEADNDKGTKRTIQTTVFDSSDGVRPRAIPNFYGPQVAKSPDGKLWFTSVDGFSVVDPRHLVFNNVPPPVHIEQITIDGKIYDASNRLSFPSSVRDVWIDYTALSLAAPEKIRFRYQLEGQDPDWKEVVNVRQAQYSNLRPGNYRFRVIASNNSGVWNEQGAALDFSIEPAYYQTRWFLASLAALFLAMLWAAYQVRIQGLKRGFKQLRDVVETIPAMAWTARPDGTNEFMNKRWAEFTGLSAEDTAGSDWMAAVHPEDRQILLDKWRASLNTGDPLEFEARVRSAATGEYRWLLARGVPMRDAHGNILRWHGILTDIQDRKHAEEERETRRQLETHLAHLSRVSMMGELTASIAHEVNQPLTGIVSNGSACLRWLAGDPPNVSEVREAVGDMVRDGKRAAEVIARIRALSRRTPLPSENLNLNEVIREVLVLVEDKAKRDGVRIRTQFAGDLWPVSGDRVQLQQVVLNLVMNGIEALSSVEQRARELLITTANIDGNQVLVTVRDSGPGVDPDAIAKIFEPFYTTKSGGMGMGLFICRSILQNHGGRLWASANDGSGATLQFSLPKHRAEGTGNGGPAGGRDGNR